MANAKRPTSAHAPSARPATRPTAQEAEERALHAEARLAELDAALVATREEIERVAADFDNYRKRQVREREQQAVAANERLVLDLLPVLDALELAVDAFDNHEAEKVREGVAY